MHLHACLLQVNLLKPFPVLALEDGQPVVEEEDVRYIPGCNAYNSVTTNIAAIRARSPHHHDYIQEHTKSRHDADCVGYTGAGRAVPSVPQIRTDVTPPAVSAEMQAPLHYDGDGLETMGDLEYFGDGPWQGGETFEMVGGWSSVDLLQLVAYHIYP